MSKHLNRQEVADYLAHLQRNIPSQAIFHLESVAEQVKSDPIKTIGRLMRMHIASIPWGSLALHYTASHDLPLSPPSYLLNKTVRRGLGGYCMEQNLLFSHVLATLGYKFYFSGARISNSLDIAARGKDLDGYGGWSHMVIFVIHEGQKYLVDVGFGSGNATDSILLKDGEEVKSQPGMIGRLVRRPIAASVQAVKQEMWMYQNKVVGKEDVGEGGWTNAYCFTELEWFESDFAVLNFKTSKSPKSWFTYTVILTRMILQGEEAAGSRGKEVKVEDGKENPIVGSVTLMGGTLTRRVGGGESEVIKECTTESERVEVLRQWFGARLTEEDIGGIKATVTELKG
jgi:arylamine N-acetyltransferase